MTRRLTAALLLALTLQTTTTPAADGGTEVELPPVVVTATRSSLPIDRVASSIDRLDGTALRQTGALTLDESIRMASQAFGLFRRSSSLTAHPTAQGLSLRGLAPNGAGRALVLLDDVPLNDPFGGWITWSKIPTLPIDGVEIVRGGGSGAWGSGAIGGVVQMLSALDDPPRSAATAEFGTNATIRTELLTSVAASESTRLPLGGRWFTTDGDFQYSPAQRGTIDRRLESEHALVHGAIDHRFASDFHLTVGARWFDESRGNGTPYQQNESGERALFASLHGPVGNDRILHVLAYAQENAFSSRFSSVSADRSTETPALDQFSVPATAIGGSAQLNWRTDDRAAWTLGTDLRSVTGETREDFFYSAGTFLRRRHAGGDALQSGVFLTHTRTLAGPGAPLQHLQAALRADHWRLDDGHRREWQKQDGTVLRDDLFPDRSGNELSPSLGLGGTVAGPVRWRASGWRGFRAPTLNELYRPFRVGNVATDANPALDIESVAGTELAFDVRSGAWSGSLTGFYNDLSDAVTNVTLSSTPALTTRQRRNLETIRSRGLEFAVRWQANAEIAFSAGYQFVDATVGRSTVAPTLSGLRIAQVPQHTATIQADWNASPGVRATLAARYVSSQFEDDENLLRLDSAITLDGRISVPIASRFTAFLAAENLLDADIETSRTSDGLIALAPGRAVRMGLTTAW